MPFTSPLVVRRVDAKRWELVAPLSYQGRVDHWTIPSGYRTDFASVPDLLQSFVQATGLWTLAAILHDWHIDVAIPAGLINSRDADGVFRWVLREEGVGPARRWAMWTAVRWAALKNRKRRPGWFTWPDAPQVVAITAVVLAVAYYAVRGLDLVAHWLF